MADGDEDSYTGPAWYRPGKNRDLFLGLVVLGTLLALGGGLTRCDAGRDVLARFGLAEVADDIDDLVEEVEGGGIDDLSSDQLVALSDGLEGRLGDALGDADLSEVDTAVDLAGDDRVAVLTGVVASEALKTRAGEVAGDVEGITDVDNQLVVDPDSGTETTASPGTSPDPTGQPTTVPATSDVPDTTAPPPTDTVAPTDPPPTDPPAVGPPFDVVGQANGETLVLTGAVPSAVLAEAISGAVAQEAGAGVVVNELTVDEELSTDGTLTLRGEAADDELAAAMRAGVAAAADAAGGVTVTDELSVAEPSGPVERDLNALVNAQPILFNSGRSTIRNRSNPVLDRIAAVLVDEPDARVTIEGHTDSQGPAGLNLTLSQDRAESVRAALIERGVSADRLRPIGRGEQVPVGDNATAQGRAQNRRIVFLVR